MNFDSAVFYTNDLGKVLDFYKDILGITLEFKDEERYLSFIFPNGARLGIKRKTTDREIPGAQTVIFSVEKDIEKDKGLYPSTVIVQLVEYINTHILNKKEIIGKSHWKKKKIKNKRIKNP